MATEETLGEAKQNVNMNPQQSQNEQSLAFLESFTPFLVDDKNNQVLRGNIPQATLVDNWELLNQHLALGNMDKEDVGTVAIMAKRNLLNTISSTPANKFTVNKLRELDRVKMSCYLLSTKSIREGERDRKLIPAVVTLSETRSQYREEAMQAQKKRSIFNPLTWF